MKYPAEIMISVGYAAKIQNANQDTIGRCPPLFYSTANKMTYACHATLYNLAWFTIYMRCTTSYNQYSLFFQWARTHGDARLESSSISTSRHIQIQLKQDAR